ncbi:HlyD family secretion protein [Capnocytophaga catalasegens]|uniref:Hemolysin secretion protein D n=1 Tax=Capnocytophaga catalasegens TaxID=1004260 RepID=A0AAV5ATI7_9FLAO|nr:efflux RND transporter periplasmic adaptor subunit [Capnocytophaga catalasegens]GIZ15812.1 hemolysin secretion protein D [Capnocytophaga catalasegens]GJM49824.1 hemolysin secretion protein D [Capnocytophaga catalasegens]GJM52989.1 hemolysin secretion protein D [Capnocytophaga catalasegens]
MKGKKVIKLLLLLVIVGISVVILSYLFRSEEQYWQGQAEAKQVSVAPKIPGRIDKIWVHEGQRIEKGTLLLSIETPEINAKLEQANAAHDAAEAQLAKANSGARTQQIQAAYSVWQQAKTAADFAKTSFDRVENMYKDELISAQKRDEAYTRYQASVQQANATKAQYDLALAGAQQEDKQAAKAMVNKAQGAVNEVKAYKNEANVYAPASGEIQKIIPNEGELVNTGYPIITLVDLNEMWVVLNIREDYMNRFQKGTKFQAIVPALGNKEITLEVRHISVMADFATWTATKSQGDFDRKTFEIKAYPTTTIEGFRPGMSVLVRQ